jgi:hypothetical protein
VQVDGGAAQGDLGVGEPPHGGDGAGHVGCGHAGVADDDDVAGEPVGLLLQQGGEVRRAGLLLALDQQLDGDGGGVPAGCGEVRADAEQVEGDVALVVDRTAGVQLGAVRSVDAGGLERRVLPQVEGVHRLDVVVAVDERHGSGRVARWPLGEDGRRTRSRPDLHGREARAAQRLGQPGGARRHLGGVRRVGRYRRDAQPGVEVGVQVVEVAEDIRTFGVVAFRAAHGHRR